MIERIDESVLLRPRDIQPSQSGLEVIGVFNPSVALVGDTKVMLVRVAERPAEKRVGWTPLPRWSPTGEAAVDWVHDEDLIHTDARVVALKSNGDLRLTSVSHLQILRTTNSESEKWEFVDVLLPQGSLEEYGIEDPRITKIDDTYWITYVAVSRSGAATALMSSTDLVTFQRHGIIFPSENKDVVLFPDRIAGDYVALHRPNPSSHFSPPQIWIARSPDLIHWGRHEVIIGGAQAWEGDRVGSGTPPILCDEGWLTLYHGSAIIDTSLARWVVMPPALSCSIATIPAASWLVRASRSCSRQPILKLTVSYPTSFSRLRCWIAATTCKSSTEPPTRVSP